MVQRFSFSWWQDQEYGPDLGIFDMSFASLDNFCQDFQF